MSSAPAIILGAMSAALIIGGFILIGCALIASAIERRRPPPTKEI